MVRDKGEGKLICQANGVRDQEASYRQRLGYLLKPFLEETVEEKSERNDKQQS